MIHCSDTVLIQYRFVTSTKLQHTDFNFYLHYSTFCDCQQRYSKLLPSLLQLWKLQ